MRIIGGILICIPHDSDVKTLHQKVVVREVIKHVQVPHEIVQRVEQDFLGFSQRFLRLSTSSMLCSLWRSLRSP